ncbi:MAG: DUF4406 domain-containing protein [Candidatus Dormibacteria bacterium]
MNSRPLTIYISGPMRGYPENNFPAFDKAKQTLSAMGYLVMSPADSDRELWKTTPPEQVPLSEYMRRDLLDMDQCDIMVLLENWENSSGTAVELAYAQYLDLPVFDFGPWLPEEDETSSWYRLDEIEASITPPLSISDKENLNELG